MYKAQFEVLLNSLKGLSKRHKLSFFLSGLKDEIRLPVKMLSLINLSATFGFAKIQEEYIMTSRRTWKHNGLVVEKGPLESIT